MSIIKLTGQNFERYELIARPEKIFRSSSSGVEGDILLMKDASPSLKDISRKSTYSYNIDEKKAYKALEQYNEEESIVWEEALKNSPEEAFKQISSASQGLRYKKRQEVFRTFPGTKFNKEFLKKRIVKNSLFPYYRGIYDSMEWGYTNYHSLNFFQDSKVPNNSVLIYPATASVWKAPEDKFTFQFYIKPTDISETIQPYGEVETGTILHMSSCFAISLVTGSNKNELGLTSDYRILLQLSQSADIHPRHCVLGESNVTSNASGDPGFLFASSDNSLPRNLWTHVAIRWPGSLDNNGTGSFVINGVEDSTFVIKSGSVMQTSVSTTSGLSNPDAIFLGNYYTGPNSAFSTVSSFFNTTVSENEGVTNLSSTAVDPTEYEFDAPLRAELHEIKIYNTYRSNGQIGDDKKRGSSTISSDLIFYVPPFFLEESRERQILQTPFMTEKGRTNDAFNIPLSFGLGALDINLENFTRELVTGEYPRLLNLTSSEVVKGVYKEGQTAHDVIYDNQPAARKKLRTILPCDNGLFRPDYSLIKEVSEGTTKYVDYLGAERLDLINLDNLVDNTGLVLEEMSVLGDLSRSEDPDNLGSYLSSTSWGSIGGTGSGFGPEYFLKETIGASPEDPSLATGSILSVLHRTGDPSSNEIVMFDISNMFYGDSITPGTLLIEDLAPTGSNGNFTFKVRDNLRGSLYRSDLANDSKAAKWASVGNVLYEDGIIVLKSPHLAYFGKEDFRITFKGNKTVYVYEVSIPVERSKFNLSSNPTYKDLIPSDYSNEIAQKFTYITGINLHDDNFNIVGKATLSQPFVKRDEDKVVIKLRMDF